jgi:hypothetical protein
MDGDVMPVFDCEDYSLNAMGVGAMQLLADEIRASGEDPDQQPVSFVNIYLGVQHLRTRGDRPWWVCVSRPHGFLTIVLHRVRHGDVVVTTMPELAETLGLCITLLWTTKGNLVDELEDAIRQADQLVKQVEMRFGVPLPLPLKKQQMPDRFAVRTIDPSADEGKRITTSILVPPVDHGIEIDPETAVIIGTLLEALGPIEEVMSTPMLTALHTSSKWQRQAIRARGMEEWSDVVIASNTWIETFLVQLAVLLNEAAGTPISDVQAAVMKGGLPRFVNTYLGQKFLKGPWDRTRQETEFGRWYEKCFSLRNAIVHTGQFATETEATDAYTAAHDLAHYVTARVAAVHGDRFDELLQPLKTMAKIRNERAS